MVRRALNLLLLATAAHAVPTRAEVQQPRAAAASPAAAVPAAAASASVVHPGIWPQPAWPLATDPAVETRIAALVARMTPAEKVGQVIQADIASVTPDEVRRYHLGSVLNGGNSAPGGDEFAPPAAWLALADAFWAASTDTAGGRTAIPVMWGTDAVHGHSNIVGATLFPHNVGLGAAHDPDLVERIGAATAREIRATGIEWTFAPTITVPRDLRWGRAYEGYSSDPKLVALYADRMIRGLQGAPGPGPLLATEHVIASTKHFIADGGTHEGRDQGDARIPETELRDIHGLPYVPAIEAGVATIMTSFSSWQGVKIAGHKGLVTDVLKGRMNFGGLVVTDWNAHGQIAGCTNASCPDALLAGVDMYMAPDSWRDLHRSLLAQVESGIVPMARLDEAVARILRVKMRLGLFEAGAPSSRPLSGRFELLGAPGHRALAREAVRKSLVLLKNDNGLLPLKPGVRLLVAGDGADDIARQSGGWTLTWQGTGLGNERFPGATSLWAGLKAAAEAAGGSATLAPDGRYTQRPDAAIVVFGETPYAEFQGDLDTLELRPELRAPFETMARLKAEGIPVIALMLTGRPLFVNPALNRADAFVVAWLPGSEGGGVADMLLQQPGAPARPFTGRLSFAWPATARADGPTLFPLGFGLAGPERQTLAPLPEDPGVAATETRGLFLERGVPASGWSLVVGGGTAGTTRITTVPATAGDVVVTATDHLVQEGARAFAVASGPGSVELATMAPLDLTRETNGDVLLLFSFRRDGPTTPLQLALACGPGCGGTLAAPALSSLPERQWQTVGVPLKCFAAAGADMARVDVPFRLVATGPARFSLSRVAVGTVADTRLPCQPARP
jgi:beta-glucosidase